MNRQDTVVVAIDPGLTCGWSRAAGESKTLEVGHLEGYEMLDQLYHMLSAGAVERIVCERFDPRRWDDETTRTVEVVGAIRWLAHLSEMPLGFVNPADKQRTIGDVPHDVKLIGQHAVDAEAVRLWDLRYGRW